MVEAYASNETRFSAEALRRQIDLISGVGGQRSGRTQVKTGRPCRPELYLAKQFWSLDRRQYQIHLAGDGYAFRFQEPRSRVSKVLEDSRIETEVADLIGHHSVNPLRQADMGRESLDESDAVTESVGLCEFTRDRADTALFNGIDPASTRATRKQTENACSGCQVQNSLAGLYDGENGRFKGGEPHAIRKQLSMLVDD